MLKRCLNDNVLVCEIIPEDITTPGGLLLPSNAAGQSKRGTMAIVVMVGPGQKLDIGDQERYRLDLIEGSIVLLAEKSGDPIILDGKNYLIVPERYILAVVSEPTKEN